MIEPASRAEADTNVDEDLVEVLRHRDEQLRLGATVSSPVPLPETSEDVSATLDFLTVLERLWPRNQQAMDAARQTVVGHFRIERALGRGGFGIVYLATDTRLGRKVALKIPRLHALAEPKLLNCFAREARAAAALEHPHIVPVYEAGEADGLCYIASSYCPGPTLAEWLRGQKSACAPPLVAATMVRQLADAVAYSHIRGIVHRDIKSSNVLLDPRSADGREFTQALARSDVLDYTPKLADFGLAKMVAAAVGDGKNPYTETAGSLVMGTPAYMAPEQFDSNPPEAAHAADIYSLGIVLYELLTGRVPFPGVNPAEIIFHARHDEPVSVRRLRPETPRDLETICLKCLEKSPTRRYDSAADLRDDLQRFLDGKALLARPPGRWDIAAKWVRRRPAFAALLLVTAVSLSSAMAGLWWHSHKLEEGLEVLRRQKADLKYDLYVRDIASASSAVMAPVPHGKLAKEYLSRSIPTSADEHDPRGSEWHYLWSQVTGPPLLQTFRHQSAIAIYSAAMSPDGTIVVTGDVQGMIRVWDVASGQQVRALKAYDGEVKTLEFTPDGRTLVCGGQFYDVHLWDTATWVKRTISATHDGSVQSMAISFAGDRIATGGRDGWLRIWNLHTGEKLSEHRFDNNDEGPRVVYGVHFSNDDANVIALLDDGFVTFDAQLQRIGEIPSEQFGSPRVSAYAPAADRLVVAGIPDHGENGHWYTGWREPHHYSIPSGRPHIYTTAISADGVSLIFGERNGFISLYREGSFRFWSKWRWFAHPAGTPKCELSVDGRRLLTASSDGSAKLWDLSEPNSNRESWILVKNNSGLRPAAFSPDSRYVALARPFQSKGFSVYDLETGRSHTFGFTKYRIPDVVFSDDGQSLIGMIRGQGMLRWALSAPQTPIIPIKKIAAFAMGAAPELAFIVRELEGDEGWEVAEWNLDTNSRERRLYLATGEIRELVYRKKDGILLIVPATPGAVVVCATISNGRPLALESVPEVGDADISPTQDVVALADTSTVTLVNFRTNETVAVIPIGAAPNEYDIWVKYSHDGSRLAISRSREPDACGNVLVWEVARRNPLLNLEVPHSRIGRPEWSPDGRRLLVERMGTPSMGSTYGAGAVVWTFGPVDDVDSITPTPIE